MRMRNHWHLLCNQIYLKYSQNINMKKFIVTFLAMVCVMQIFAQSDIKWLSKVYDFGAFDEDTKEKFADFKFVNTTSEPVAVISATASCGCTVPKYDEQAIAPGDTAVIKVSYDPSGRPGRFNKYVYVRTSVSPERHKLVIKGTVIGSAETIKGRYPVSLGPLKLRTSAAMIGRVFEGQKKMHFVDGYNQYSDTLRPIIVSTPEFLSVTVEPEAVAPGDMMNLELRFSGDVKGRWGLISDSIAIEPIKGGETFYFPVTAIVEEDFSKLTQQQRENAPIVKFSTDRVMLPTIKDDANEPVSADFTITNEGKSDLLIRRVYSEDPGIKVESKSSKIAKGKSTTIKVSFDPKAQLTGLVNARVTVITNAPDNPMQVIRIVGERN